MDWIKKNPHLFALSLLSVLLLGAAGAVIASSLHFSDNFASVMEPVVPGTKLTALDLAPLEQAQKSLQSPAKWTGANLLVPEPYDVNPTTNVPEKAGIGDWYKDTLTGAPIPNKWFTDNGLSITDSNIQHSDTDGDGFKAEDEWRGSGGAPGTNSTNPNDPKSHPPYYTKLFLRKFIQVPFLFIFESWEGNKEKPETIDFAINPKNMGGRAGHTVFLKLGDKVQNSNYVLNKFEYKTKVNPKTGEEEDVSELILLNTETNETVILPLHKLVDSPDSYALFVYEWPQPNKQFQVKKTKTFALPPDNDKLYTVLDIQENQAVIQTPDGQKVAVKPDPRLH